MIQGLRFLLSLFIFAAVLLGQNVYSGSLKDLKLRWPVDQNKKYIVSSTFGESRLDHFHNGLDIAGKGFAIYPLAEGRVIWKSEAREKMGELPFGGGKTVIMDHGDFWSGYMHLESIGLDAQGGQGSLDGGLEELGEEALLGRAGDSGHSGRAHLHFFVYTPGDKRMHNPLPMLPEGMYHNNIKPQARGYAIKLPEEFVQVNIGGNFTMSRDFPLYAKFEDSGTGLERWGVYFFESYDDTDGQSPVKRVVFDYIEFNDGRWTTSNGLEFSDVYHESWYNLGEGFRTAKTLRWRAGGYLGPAEEESHSLNIRLE